jgi:hypothetical protein
LKEFALVTNITFIEIPCLPPAWKIVLMNAGDLEIAKLSAIVTGAVG